MCSNHLDILWHYHVIAAGLYRRTRLAKAGEAGEFHAAPLLPGPTTARFPFSGTAVMTALRPPYTSVRAACWTAAAGRRQRPAACSLP